MENETSAAASDRSDDSIHLDASDSRHSQGVDSSLTDDFSDEESICRSPAKSPKKAVRKLAQRNVSTPPSSEQCDAEKIGEYSGELKLPTDADFQFKEPKFRKKKFIFHPFKRAEDHSCIPDPAQVSDCPVQVLA
jgi:hypothetical protein